MQIRYFLKMERDSRMYLVFCNAKLPATLITGVIQRREQHSNQIHQPFCIQLSFYGYIYGWYEKDIARDEQHSTYKRNSRYNI